MADASRRPGRPRDTSIDERALVAARELLAEQGFEATTIQAVAVRSGVHASAIYRRWSSRIELIEDAAFPMESPLKVSPTGDLREDLRRFIRAYTDTFSDPATRAAAGPLLAHRRSDAGHGAAYQRVSVRPQFFAILESAPPGTVDPTLDPNDVFDMLLGAVWTRIVVPITDSRPDPVERTVEMIVRMLRPVNDEK
ncbi:MULTISPECIES: TetR/AcrR family transcriptional regulator C-terminal ligand-binding domain-containing protein [unclassified Rhodococcus (in: high G+C Gram-positive bacteria)]|uniref:TetR/AcrR family transcriptional regulator n=1 Tax=Rhodococcus sp. SJ-3 TaxID=3454628 RepID=UPI003F7AC159